MYKRKLNQVTIFEDPAMFGGISLNPNNAWVKLANLIPWWAFEEKYAEQFPSDTGQPADSLRVALGSQLIKEKYHFSDEMIVEEIAMNPYLQYFLGFPEYRQTPPFDPSMMTRFRQRLTPELMQEVNDVIIGRKKAESVGKDSHDDDPPNDDGGSSEEEPASEESEDDSIHLTGPKLGRPTKNPEVRKAELILEWLESGERGDIERRIGIGKRTTSLGLITAKLEHTSEVMAYTSVLTVNLQKRLRLLLRLLLALLRPARAV